MSLTAGARLGPYEIHSVVGAGGMGEVYRARDPRLGRDVAIKVLPAGISDPERLARFEQEARAAAALNHPNILAVFDFGTHAGAPYIVAELLEGQTLRDRLDAGGVAVRKAVDYAIQIARGLAAAHDKGIVHRDLKPENVFVTADERVKILDFGLAKLTQPQAAISGASMAATAIGDTAPGMVMGTVGYMSPEQVRGAAADHRSDIFALGALLYEMITGVRAFQRDTPAETMTAILRDEPALEASPAVPLVLERLIRRCLEKNASARFQSALDLAFALESLDAASGSAASPVMTSGRGPSRHLLWVVAALLIAAVALGREYLRGAPPPAPTVGFGVLPPEGWVVDAAGGLAPLLAVSPDGFNVAFVARNREGRTQIWIRPVAALEPRALAGTEGGQAPFWSPDGRWIGFFADSKLKKIDANGGVPLALCDAPSGTHGTWNRDDTIVFSTLTVVGGVPAPGQGLQRVSAAGGAATRLTTMGPADLGQGRPSFLPDGRRFLFTVGNATASDEASRTVYVASLDTPDRTELFKTDSLNVTYASGHLLFLRGLTLVAQAFDPERLTLSGEPIPVAEEVGVAGTVRGNRFGVFSASDTGVLAYQTSRGVAVHQLAWFDRTGRHLADVGDRASHQSIELMRNGIHAPLSVMDAARGTRDIWMFDTTRGVRTRFTFDSAEERSAIPSPDGRRVVFNSQRDGALELFEKAASGAGTETLILKDGRSKDPMDWSTDQQYLLYRVTGDTRSNDIWVLPMTGEKKPFPLIATPFDDNYARISPDGRWVAYTSNESGRYEVYVAPFPGGGSKSQVSNAGGAFPRWRQDGREIFYMSQDGRVHAAAVSADASDFAVGAVSTLFKFTQPNAPGYPYAVTGDGQRFLVNTNVAPPTPITVLVNWTNLLQSR